MADHKSAKKRNRQTIKRTVRNVHLKSRMRSSVKVLRELITKKKAKEAQEKLKEVTSLIASTASKGSISKATASRYISRLSKHVTSMGSAKK